MLIVTIILGYLYFVFSFGPKFMKDRKPYELSSIITIYNAVQVATNLTLGLMVSCINYVSSSTYRLLGNDRASSTYS